MSTAISRPAKTYKSIGLQGPWIVRCAPGLGRVSLAELRFRHLVSGGTSSSSLRQRNHDIIFIPHTDAPLTSLLRIPEEIHYCLVFGRFKISKNQLDRLSNVLRLQNKSFKIVSTADGPQFSRHDMKRWLTSQLRERGVIMDDNAAETLWIFCIEEAFYICLPANSLSDSPFRNKRQAERTGALPPTIAAAMAFLGELKSKEVILDPVCGTGTLLAEAYGYAQDAALYGIDLDGEAIKIAKKNLEHVPNPKLVVGDGTSTKIPDGTVTLFLANLPFGKQYGDRETNPQLYRKLLAEMMRVGVPMEWRAVLLSSDIESFESTLKTCPELNCAKRVRIKVRGEWAQIFVIRPVKSLRACIESSVRSAEGAEDSSRE